MHDFDKQFNRTRNFAVGAFIFYAMFWIGIISLLIWVAAHFLAKFW